MGIKVKNTFEQIVFYAFLIMFIIGSGTACAWLFKMWMAANSIIIK